MTRKPKATVTPEERLIRAAIRWQEEWGFQSLENTWESANKLANLARIVKAVRRARVAKPRRKK